MYVFVMKRVWSDENTFVCHSKHTLLCLIGAASSGRRMSEAARSYGRRGGVSIHTQFGVAAIRLVCGVPDALGVQSTVLIHEYICTETATHKTQIRLESGDNSDDYIHIRI